MAKRADLTHTALAPDSGWEKMKQSGLLGARPIHFLENTESTNSVAMALGQEGASHGTAVVAESQSKGRGRLSRRWFSPPGTGLYFSVLLHPCLQPADLPKITLTAGLAVCEALEEACHLQPGLKWPNDILLHGRKCGGILTEARTRAEGKAPLVVVGIGLNVTTPLAAFPKDIRDTVTTLLEASGRSFQRSAILAAILTRLAAALARLEAGGFSEILSQWRQRDALSGAKLSWLTPAGALVTGVSLGPDKNGILRVRDEQGRTHEVLSGDVALAGS